MKQQIIIDVMQQMLPHLDNAQMQKLQKVLEYTLHGCEITVLEENDNDNSQLVESSSSNHEKKLDKILRMLSIVTRLDCFSF